MADKKQPEQPEAVEQMHTAPRPQVDKKSQSNPAQQDPAVAQQNESAQLEPAKAQAQAAGLPYEHVEGIARALGDGSNLAKLLPFLINLFKLLKDTGILGAQTGEQPPQAPGQK